MVWASADWTALMGPIRGFYYLKEALKAVLALAWLSARVSEEEAHKRAHLCVSFHRCDRRVISPTARHGRSFNRQHTPFLLGPHPQNSHTPPTPPNLDPSDPSLERAATASCVHSPVSSQPSERKRAEGRERRHRNSPALDR